MKFKKILVYNIDRATSLDARSWKRIESFTDKIVFLPKDSPQLKKELLDTDAILVNFGTTIRKEEIDSAPDLKYIGVIATAFGKIDISHAKKKKVIVSNLKGYSTDSVAEFIFAALLEHIRSLEEGKERAKSGNYSESGISASEIKNKVFGIVGLGTIGQRVADIAPGLGATVRYWSRTRRIDYEKKGVKYQPLDTLIGEANIISINLAQTKETGKIFDKKVFQKIKSRAIIINTAPMELIDIDELEQRLRIDDIVFILDHSDEMSEADLKKLSKHPNCIIYPPIAYVSKEATDNKKKIFIGNIESFLRGDPVNIVNP